MTRPTARCTTSVSFNPPSEPGVVDFLVLWAATWPGMLTTLLGCGIRPGPDAAARASGPPRRSCVHNLFSRNGISGINVVYVPGG